MCEYSTTISVAPSRRIYCLMKEKEVLCKCSSCHAYQQDIIFAWQLPLPALPLLKFVLRRYVPTISRLHIIILLRTYRKIYVRSLVGA